ncbi:IRE kinase [Apiospora saccharicola]|uniref:non-specific serine/threonine protein kinase n=1 Tax=Apiospora saccharicola TaxID=335842 RepID=A0ABR1UDT2_9PEZI
MWRRPPGEGRLVAEQRKAKVFLALAVFVLPWLTLVDAQQQQQSLQYQQPQVANILRGDAASRQHQPRIRHQAEYDGQEENGMNVAQSSRVKKPIRNQSKQPSTPNDYTGNKNINPSYDASALATVAPETPVRASNSPRQLSSVLAGAGLSSLHYARSLGRWEVEDYVLLATVDGHLYAVNKESGDERWHLEVEQPAVETIHHRPNNTLLEDYNYHPLDDHVWAVEPTQHGPVYLWQPSGPNSGLNPTGFTMKQLVDDLGPYAVPDPPVVYTGDKKTTMVSVDAATGRVLKWFGQSGSQVDQGATCFRPNGLVDSSSEACTSTGIITLSRTEYTVSIHRQDDGRALATLRYTEWGPNSYDQDLHRQYTTTQNGRYITTGHNGKLFTYDGNGAESSMSLQFPVPVGRVFDVARPGDAPQGSNPELVLLPQPIPPTRSDEDGIARASSIFLNRTETGGWYALSGAAYPLVLDAPVAEVQSKEWADSDNTWSFDDAFVNEALVGKHQLGHIHGAHRTGRMSWPQPLPALPQEPEFPEDEDSNNASLATVPDDGSDLANIVEKVKTLPEYALTRVRDFVTNPILFLLIMSAAIWYLKGNHIIRNSPKYDGPTITQTVKSDKVITEGVGQLPNMDAPTQAEAEEAQAVKHENNLADAASGSDEGAATALNGNMQPGGDPQQPVSAPESPEKKKRKTHRGTRGGAKHKKKKQDQAQGQDDKSQLSDHGPTQEDINKIKHIPQETHLQPNVKSVVDDPRDISTTGFETTNGLRVNLDDQLGMGSNGTVVYSGTFHMREVAVKRMLAVFYDIAYQETQLLLESDNHPNVIQYYAFHQENAFLYIALERCHASLADIVDKPHMHRELARAGELDIPNVLLQIANGLSHLHNLRIVHRDLKPQNILVTMTKDGRPRLVVSDFGLCKKLDGAQSSFGATTAHAAGTSGWRAPELLLDDDAREGSASMSSSHSESSQLVSSGLMPNRRATRAIDIFSLGLVFFYVLTKGCHPFDCGDRYMREVNIRKGQLNLQPLDILGDFAYEAKDLVRIMLLPEPRDRPNIREVMAHPFFWDAKKRLTFLCDVSDHFEKEVRDPPSDSLMTLEHYAPRICRGDFLKLLTKDFVESLGKQRKYTGTRMLDLLRALRNKWNHREDMSEALKKSVGTSHEEYLGYWSRRFPDLLSTCYEVIWVLDLQEAVRFKEYFEPMKP